MPDYNDNRSLGSGFTDLDEYSRFRTRAPNLIIRKTMIDAGGWDNMDGDDFISETVRRVVYEDAAGTRWYHELVLYEHPAGAGALTIGAWVGDVFTPSCKSKLLLESGAFATSRDDNADIAGQLFSHYTDTSSNLGSPDIIQPRWAEKIEEGDFIWLIRNGTVEFLADAAVTAGDTMCTENGTTAVDGAVAKSVTTIASQAEIKEVITGPSGRCVGLAVDSAVAAAYFKGKLELGSRQI